MNISNYKDEYIKIQSSYIDGFIADPSLYDEIDITGNINCCVNNCENQIAYTDLINVVLNKWIADITTLVNLDDNIEQIYLRNTTTSYTYQVLTTPLAHTDTTGIATAINDWFAAVGLTTTVTVESTSATLTLIGLPSVFTAHSLTHGAAAPYTEVLFQFHDLTEKVFVGHDGIYVKPQFFGDTELRDGIYTFTIKLNKPDGGNVIEENCSFIDRTIKCKVAAHLNKLKDEAHNKQEPVGTIIHMIHYALVNGSNCGCNCDELCTLYNELYVLINNTKVTSNCGC